MLNSPTKDFHESVKTIKAPEGLPQGFYYLASSHDKNFGAGDNVCHYTSFWVSDLAIVIRQRHGNGRVEGFVLDALSGEPVANAKVRAWFRNGNQRTEANPTTSNDKGFFSFQAIQRGYLLQPARATNNSAPTTTITITAAFTSRDLTTESSLPIAPLSPRSNRPI